jgi:hypothetical protein
MSLDDANDEDSGQESVSPTSGALPISATAATAAVGDDGAVAVGHQAVAAVLPLPAAALAGPVPPRIPVRRILN